MLLAYGVPRNVLGQVTSGDRSSAEVTEWIFEKHTVQPLAMLVADSLTLQLAGDFEGDVYIRPEEFVTQDKDHRLLQEGSDLDRKVKSINEIREDRGLDPVPWGEDPTELALAAMPTFPGVGTPAEDAQEEEEEDEEPERRRRPASRRLAL